MNLLSCGYINLGMGCDALGCKCIIGIVTLV